jgi:poly(beta-D-mannuronate) lyase
MLKWLCLAASLLIFNSTAAERIVSSPAEIASAKAGETLVMKDGVWTDAITLRGSDLTLRAQTPGKVILTGQSHLRLEGHNLTVSGLHFTNCLSKEPAILVIATNSRVTDTAVEGGESKFHVRLHGLSNRVDHCYFADKMNDDPTFQIEVEGRPNYHHIDHNLFGHRPPLGRNGGETMRIGYSHQSMTNSRTLVEFNLFDQCDGELEIISNKSCENTYRSNYFLNSAGMFTLRHGNRCLVEGNYFDGKNKKGSGGIRVIGEGHRIIGNYIDSVAMGGFWITSGIVDSELKGYFQAKDCVIANNTFVNSPGPAMQLDAGINSSRRTLRPENIIVTGNTFLITDGQLYKGTEGANWKWEGNRTNIIEVLGPMPPVTRAQVGPTWMKQP